MGNCNWMLDVLTDIEDYARLNDLPHIADEVEKARHTANKELSGRMNKTVSDSIRTESPFRAHPTS